MNPAITPGRITFGDDVPVAPEIHFITLPDDQDQLLALLAAGMGLPDTDPAVRTAYTQRLLALAAYAAAKKESGAPIRTTVFQVSAANPEGGTELLHLLTTTPYTDPQEVVESALQFARGSGTAVTHADAVLSIALAEADSLIAMSLSMLSDLYFKAMAEL